MNTREGNKLIAEFMGAPKCNTSTPQYDFTEVGGINVPHGWKYETNLRFHCDWGWLMPVVKKIRKMSRNNEMLDDISINTYIGWYKMWRSDLSIFSDKETIYKFCVDFIKEYNHTKKPDNPLDHTPTIEESPFLYKRKEIHV